MVFNCKQINLNCSRIKYLIKQLTLNDKMVIHNLCCSFNSAEHIVLTVLRQSEYSTHHKYEKFIYNFTKKPCIGWWQIATCNCFECILCSNKRTLFFLMYPEKAHIQGKEGIQLPHSRVQCQIYKHDNEFTVSVKEEKFLNSWVTFNFSLHHSIL